VTATRGRTAAIVAVVVLSISCGPGPAGQVSVGRVLSSVPEAPDPAAFYLLYLHGSIIEDQGPRPTHPRFGVYEFQQIVDSLAAAGLDVIAELRPAGADPLQHAEVVADQVRSLLDAGVPAEHITVAGFSKGGGIAILTSTMLDNDRVGFVLMACCSPVVPEILAERSGRVAGRLLSLYEASDPLGTSCRPVFLGASPGSSHLEIELEIGGGHGAFYRPHPEWIDPVVAWTRGDLVGEHAR
jgi:hypothetical protein